MSARRRPAPAPRRSKTASARPFEPLDEAQLTALVADAVAGDASSALARSKRQRLIAELAHWRGGVHETCDGHADQAVGKADGIWALIEAMWDTLMAPEAQSDWHALAQDRGFVAAMCQLLKECCVTNLSLWCARSAAGDADGDPGCTRANVILLPISCCRWR